MPLLQKLFYPLVELSEAIRAAPCAFVYIGALPIGLGKRAALFAVHAANQINRQAGEFVERGQDLRRDAVLGAIGRGGVVRAAHFGCEHGAVFRQPENQLRGLLFAQFA